MPAFFFPALVGALAAAMGSLIGRAILALGIGAVTYTGIDLSISALKSQVISSVNSLPSETVAFIGYLWLDKALTIIFSAVAVSLSMKLIGGSLKKVVLK